MTEVQRSGVRATIVGSLPKPSWLCGPAEMFASWQLQGDSLAEGQEDAVRLWIDAQEKAGLDVVTDGEQRRRHYIWGFLEGLDGIDTINLGKRPQRAQRYHKEISAARLVGEPDWRGPIFTDALRATRALTTKPIKVTLPGPMTIVDSLIDTIGGRSEAQLAFRFAELLNLEALALVEMTAYLEHHLKVAGVNHGLFAENTAQAIHQGSGGFLRKANLLARGALMAAAREKSQLVTAEHVRLAATELI